MRYALTGGTGFVGGALIRTLRHAGHDVTALVRGDQSPDSGVRTVRGDLFDAAALDRLCGDIDGLFHVAGWYKLGTRDPSVGRRVNVEGTRAVLTAAARCHVPRVVYTSTLAVNSDTHGAVVDESYRFTGRHISAYDRSKAEAHDVALEFAQGGLPVVVVMPGLVYGPGDTAMSGELIRDTMRGRRVIVPAAGGVCWGHVDDIANGHVLAMQRGVPGESYMLAGPPAPLIDGLRLAARLAGRRPPVGVPRTMVTASAAAAGLVGRVLPLPPAYAAETLRSSLATYYGNPAKAVAELGWSCRDMETGLSELVAGNAM
ncbi:MAG TPA: NAD-dependent epimerase/dehydratase family protein [Actinoplanes sp.]